MIHALLDTNVGRLIVTRDLAGFPLNNIPILTPQQMLLKLTEND